MRIYTSVDQLLSPHTWNEFVKRSPTGHLLQSWTWGEFKACFGWRPLRIAAVEGDQILAAMQVLFRPLPFGYFTTAYIPKGPLVTPVALNTPSTLALLPALHEACRRQRAIFLKIEPDWEETASTRSWLELQGFVPSQQTVQPRRTVLIDLTADEEAILAQMKPKTRYNIRLAQRKGVSVRMGTVEDLPLFYQLLKVTGQRAGFGIHTQDYYAQAWQLFAAQDTVALFLAEHERKPLAAIMVFTWGKKAWYMYGASSDEERQRMPTYLLQWEAMRWAKARGCETYDLWGIPDVDESEIGPDIALAEEQGALSIGLGGLYRFKKGFGGREVRYVGAYDYVYNKPMYRLLTALWKWWKG
nr:peptidoglycan bridge formation glycyltransferase FemA/FemB family protein [Chloroflexota bacterium]